MVFARDLFALFLPSLVRDEKEEREGQRQVAQTHNRVPVCLFVPESAGHRARPSTKTVGRTISLLVLGYG
jgi:hypothetical protein